MNETEQTGTKQHHHEDKTSHFFVERPFIIGLYRSIISQADKKSTAYSILFHCSNSQLSFSSVRVPSIPHLSEKMPPQANINGKAPPERKTSFRQDDDVRANILQAGEYHLDDNGHNFRKKIGFGAKVHFANAVSNMINFQRGEAETIRRVLDEIDHVAVKRMSEGFNEFNFSVGVINCFFIIYMFGAHPEHMWLVYLVEGLYMIPRKFYNMWHAKPLNQALYYLDFCWAMNFTAIVVLFFLILAGSSGSFISGYARESFYNALLGVSCGALMGANIVLPFVACLFHDVNTMTGFFIHVMPPLGE